MRWQMAYPIASALPSKPGGVIYNQPLNASIAASGMNQRIRLFIRDGGGVCSIALIIPSAVTNCTFSKVGKRNL